MQNRAILIIEVNVCGSQESILAKVVGCQILDT